MTRVAILRYTRNSKEADYLDRVLGSEWLVCGRPWAIGGFLPVLSGQPITWQMSLPVSLERMTEEYDVLNAPEVYSRLSAFAARACSRGGTKLAVTVWETIRDHFTTRFPPYRWWVKDVLNEATVFVPQTERAARYLRTTYDIDEDRMKTIYPGVDLSVFKPRQRENEDGRRALFVGRLASWKGVHDLLRAWKGMPERYHDAELWFCGDGFQRRTVTEAAHCDPSVRHLGWIERHRLPLVYNQCDLLCMPSLDRRIGNLSIWEEQFGFSMVEAMSCGLPVIGYDCGVIREIAGPRNIVLPQGAVQELQEAIQSLFDDPVRRRQMGAANRKRAQALFDATETVEAYNQVFAELVSGD